MALYRNQTEILSILFDATDSDKENWYSKNRIIDSPWTDLNSNPPPTYFSILGEAERLFYFGEAFNGWDLRLTQINFPHPYKKNHGLLFTRRLGSKSWCKRTDSATSLTIAKYCNVQQN